MEEIGTVRGERVGLPSNLLDLIFSWSIGDVFNENLYKNKVAYIPRSFDSVGQYLRSFIYPLLEETRADLHSSMETISCAPFSEISWIRESNCADPKLYEVKVSNWENKSISGSDKKYTPSPGDILILSNLKPETVSDLNRFGTRYVLASISRVIEDDDIDAVNSNPPDFIVRPSHTMDVDNNVGMCRYAIFLVNVTTNCRIWNALGLGRGLTPHSNILTEVLSMNSLLCDGPCDRCPEFELEALACTLHELNDSQKDAIHDSIVAANCNHMSYVKLIWGPPGTGKTKTLSTLLSLLTMKHRVIVCAPTNVAIREVASRVLKLVQTKSMADRRSGCGCYSLGDIVLFGNKDRLKVDDDLREIFLDYRVDRLLQCLSRYSGWRCHVLSMLKFFESCVSRYSMRLQKGFDTFHGFTREEFNTLAFPLRTCMISLCTHLSVNDLSRKHFNDMILVINLLDSFRNVLDQVNMDEKDLVDTFILLKEAICGSEYHVDEPCSTKNADGSLLFSIGCQLLHVLRSLDMNCHTPISEGDIQLLCLNAASLIFCTASTSFRLHSMKYSSMLKPLNLLVIDEASQLKESESTIPMQLPGIQHAILIGDERQLPATVKSKASEKAGFGRSLFERLSALGHSKHMLEIQYRMHPSISLFPKNEFYNGQLLDADNVTCESYEKICLPGSMYGPYSFINVVDGREEAADDGHSLKNLVEVGVVLQIVRSLYKAWCTAQHKLSIGIITPYSAQVAAIQDKLRSYAMHNDFVVKIKSVDGFQGGEEDIIIISTVRSNSSGNIGFLSNMQRTNVALTRARHCLWLIGSGATLAKSGSVWESLIHNAKQRNCFFEADEDKALGKTILQIKKELNQMDDLLNKDSVLFRNALWRVLFSGNFIKSFVAIRSAELKKHVISLLLKLASGWRPKSSNAYSSGESSSQLIMQVKVDRLYIICTIDIMKYSSYTQVLKIWDIVPLSDIPNLVKRLESICLTYTDDHVIRCRTKSSGDSNLQVPMVWGANESFIKYKSQSPEDLSDNGTSDTGNYVENSKVSESLLLMKFYSLTSGTVKHLLSNTNGTEIDLPFEVTDEERDIILYPQSTFILGRSGTGKTTVLTMKLIQREQLCSLSLDGYNESLIENSGSTSEPVERLIVDKNFLRQLFVTVSPKLCSAIRHHIDSLKSFICDGKYLAKTSFDMYDVGDSLNAFSDIPDSFMNIPTQHYPLVITFQKFLIMLDGSLDNSFFRKFHDLNKNFLEKTGGLRSSALQTLIRQKEVSYVRFSSSYWPHFDVRLTKKLDSSIVFTEIISHIKGGFTSGVTFDGKLSREAYVGLSEHRASLLTSVEREDIYAIFQDYEKMKLMNCEFDISDLVNDLHYRSTINGRYVGEQMDFVYIDEVQDLTLRQISLFRYVCKNFSEGFVFAGDTAQTIARGIDFRFQDIRSLFYTEFHPDQNFDPKKKSKGKEKSISDMFHLSQNFRTHAGVLKLAQSVIDILYYHFPHSVDHLHPETSRIFGEPPMLLETGNDENVLVALFGSSATNCDASHQFSFGADQVILVRDELSKQIIQGDVGKHALVLTILECKGLEFQDVLLYNFFSDSPLKNHWRVIYDYMNSQHLLDSSTQKVQCFELTKHNILCSELKQLYVAITRTRQRLWICENREDYSEPMFHYWKKLCLVQVRRVDVSIAETMFVTSNSEEWRDRGIKLFNEGNYEMATMCFERAGDIFREKWSRASGLRASAEGILQSNKEMGRRLIIQAAEIYESIGKVELGASCYIELNDFEKAGTIYMEKCGDSRLQDAGDCFSQAQRWSLAAKAYAKGNCYSKCCSVCLRGNLFDMGLQYIEYWRRCRASDTEIAGKVDWEEVELPFLESCALHYHRMKDSRNMMKFVKAFNSIHKARNFLNPRQYIDELLSMEVELGNYEEAVEIAKMKGDILLQADMLEKASKFEVSSRLLLFYVVMNSLWTAGRNGWPPKTYKQKNDMLMRAKLLAEKSSELSFESISVEVSILEDKEKGLADLVKILNDATRLEIVMAELFSARKILDILITSDPSKFQFDSEVDENPEKQKVKLLQNLFSSETLAFVWNMWKERICIILESLGKSVEVPESRTERHREFCMDYLGVQRYDDKYYAVYNPNALWLRQSGLSSFKKDGKLALMEITQFVSAAKSYWVSELVSVGGEVLRCLEALDRFCIRKNLPSGNRAVILLHIYQLSKYLMEFKSVHTKSLQDTRAATKRPFFEIVFPADWRLELKESIFALRTHKIAKELLKEILLEGASGKLTYGKIGKIAMIVMFIGKLDEQLHETIIKQLDGMDQWKAFIEKLRNDEPGQGRSLLASSLRDALMSTFEINWLNEEDYISPSPFLYLVERLLFMVVSTSGRNFFTTKCSFAETLGYSDLCCCFDTDAYDQVFYTESINCLVDLIAKILVDKSGTIQWIRESNLDVKQYYPLLVLKLVIMIGIVILNSGMHSNILLDVLRRKDIVSVLPYAFCEYLRNVGRGSFQEMFASALASIGNPLLVVTSAGEHQVFHCSNALFIDMSIKRSSREIMDLLFPKDLWLPCQSKAHQFESRTSADVVVSSDIGVHENKKISDLEFSQKEISATEGKSIGYELQNAYDHLCSSFDTFLKKQKTCRSGYDIKVGSDELKMEIEKLLSVLDAQVNTLNQSAPHDEEEDLMVDIQLLIGELSQLSNLLNMSEDGLVKSIPVIEELMVQSQKSRPRLRAFCNLLMNEKGDGIRNAGSADKPKQQKGVTSVPAAASVKNDTGNKGDSSKHKQKNQKNGRKGRKKGKK